MKLFFRRYGQGFPVILLHGLFGMSDNFVSFARQLADKNEVFLPDLRNHGQSGHSRVFDYSAMTEDLLEFAEDHGLLKFFLIGHSLGGKVAMQFSDVYPSYIKKLVVVDIGLRPYPGNRDHQQLIDSMLSVDLASARSRSDIDRQLVRVLPRPKLRQLILKNIYWKDDDRLSWRLNLAAINENLPRIFEGISMNHPFHGPALFIKGEHSDYISVTDFGEIKMKFPGAILETISGAGHWVHADAPGEFFKTIREFLDS